MFKPREWDTRLVKTIAPGLFEAMTTGAAAEDALKLYATARKRLARKNVPGQGARMPLALKASTATDYAAKLLDEYGIDLGDLATELPEWFLEAAFERLEETFGQDYWQGVNDFTRDNIESIIRGGIEDGKSIRDIAKEIGEESPERAGWRATNTARTETSNALNAGAEMSIRHLGEEAGEEVEKEWLSVCGSTTRDHHCALDGTSVPVDDTFNLGGHEARWPSDELLPPEERCNCQCTLISSFSAEELGDDGEDSGDQEDDEEKLYNPDQPRDPDGRFGSGGGSSTATSRDDLTEGELKTLDDWTKGYTALQVREYQAGRDSAGEAEYQKVREMLDRAPEYDGQLYRGMGYNNGNENAAAVASQFKPGAEVELSMTQSWSKKEVVAAAFSARGIDHQYIFTMNGVKGADISGLVKDGFKPQHEVVVDSFRDRSRVRVKSVEHRDVIIGGSATGMKATYVELEPV